MTGFPAILFLHFAPSKLRGAKSLKTELLANQRFHNKTRTQAASAHSQSRDATVRKLMAHALQIGVKAAFGLDIGMADQIADLRSFSTESAALAHDYPPKTRMFELGWRRATVRLVSGYSRSKISF